MISFCFDPPADHLNMALDSELLEQAEKGCHLVRLYTWTQPWVTLGRFQTEEQVLLPTTTVGRTQRITGGRAVLHGHDWTVATAVPRPKGVGVRDLYRVMAKEIIDALRVCGVDAAFVDESVGSIASSVVQSGDCFSILGSYDIIDRATGSKCCGCALRLTNQAALLQASIPKHAPIVDPATVFVHPAVVSVTQWNSAEFPRALREALSKQDSVTI